LEEIQAITSLCKDRLFFYDDYIDSDVVFDSLVSISSILFAAYINFPSSSNMIYKAALHNIPIIVSGDHLMGEQVRDFELGAALDTVTPQAILAAIPSLLATNKSYGFDRFLETYSHENLKTKLSQLLQSF